MMLVGCDAANINNQEDPEAGEGSESGARAGVWSDPRPDIVFISIDDLNDWPTPFEGPKPAQVYTPNLERLGNMGTVFQRAYCAAPMCGPSRSATLTGLPPYISGVTQQENILNPKPELGPLLVTPSATLPRLLKDGGYRTCGAGKVFHGGGYAKVAQTFPACGTNPNHAAYDYCAWDDYAFLSKLVPEDYCEPDPENGDISDSAQPCPHPFSLATSPLPDAAVARYGIDALKTKNKGGPLFLALGFFKPHKDWEAPQEFVDLYPEDSLVGLDAAVEKADQDDLSFAGCVTIRDARDSPSDETWGAATREAIAAYLGCISYVDHLLGALLDVIEERSRRTVVVLWSDHGYFMGEKRSWKKPSLFERATRVPLIIVDTGAPNPQSTHKMASLMDLWPTVLDYAGLEDPLGYGVSLRPLVEDETCQWDQTSVISTFNFQKDFEYKKTTGYNEDVVRCVSESKVAACSPDIKYACPTHLSRLAGASFALRSERYRYIRYYDNGRFWADGGGALPTRELYDLELDPNEVTNLLAAKNVTKEFEALADELDLELSASLEG